MTRIKRNAEDYEIAKRALSWIYYAKRPLHMIELREAIAVDPIYDIENGDEECTDLEPDSFTEPQVILECCGSLVLWDHSTDVVGFSHYTVSEFFNTNSNGNIEPEVYIARTSLTYLCFAEFIRGACRSFHEFKMRVIKYRLAPYIARFCGQHISGSKQEKSLQDLVLSILWSQPRRHSLLELDCDYEIVTLILSDPHGRLGHRPFARSDLPNGWGPLHFLSVWGLAAIYENLLTMPLADIQVLLECISQWWKRRAPTLNSSILCAPEDLRLDPEHPLIAPLHVACRYGHLRVVELLLSSHANVNVLYGTANTTPLHEATSGGHDGIVMLLLEKGAEVNAQGGFDGNALQAAASRGHEGIVMLLLEKGAEVNAQGGFDGNALQAAASRGDEGIVMLLLEKGADVNAQGGLDGNALQAAASGGHEGIVMLLLEKGADVNIQGGFDGNALQAAAFRGHKGIVMLLLEKGAEVNAQGGHYGNALQAAASEGHGEIVMLLLENGASRPTLCD